MTVHLHRSSRSPRSGVAALEHPAQSTRDQVQRPVDPWILDRVRGEFREMPGFSPTLAQAARMFAIPQDECARVLTALVREGFLRCAPDGQYRITSRR